jgi:predicted NBD/HSP70 family sugar kinase
VVFISIGTGIASGIFLDGQLYRGTRSSDGALGHVNVLPDGPACICGRKGCLEAVAAVPALLRELERIEPHGRGSDWTLERAREVVEIGDPAAVEALRTVARYLGVVTANIVNLLNPQMIVLGGPLPRTLPMLVELVREEVQQRAMPAELLDLQVTASALKDEAVALGAATLVLSSAEHIEKMLRGVAVFTSTRRSDSQYANA